MPTYEEAYYYFVSSLPYLHLGQLPSLSSEDFLQMAVGVMSPSAVYDLGQITLVPREDCCCEMEQKWADFDSYVRNFLVRERATHLKKDVREWQRSEGDAFPSVRSRLDEAYNTDDAKQGEWILDSLRWWYLDHITAQAPYSFGAVVSYRVKLLLAEKWGAVSFEAGQEHLNELIDDIWQEAERTREEARVA